MNMKNRMERLNDFVNDSITKEISEVDVFTSGWKRCNI